MKPETELQRIARVARTAGYQASRSRNGGGWCRLAIACGGAEHYISKIEAKAFLREKFDGIAVAETLARHESAKKAAATMQRRINKPKAWVPTIDPNHADFLTSYDWRRLRLVVLKKYGSRCMCCGATPQTGATIHVDHIKPRKLFPHLALDESNLQVLCHECNHGKGNWDQTDWRA